MVYTECAEMAAVSCGTSHVSTVSTPLRWILKNTLKVVTHVESHASAVSLLESGENCYIKAINNNSKIKKLIKNLAGFNAKGAEDSNSCILLPESSLESLLAKVIIATH